MTVDFLVDTNNILIGLNNITLTKVNRKSVPIKILIHQKKKFYSEMLENLLLFYDRNEKAFDFFQKVDSIKASSQFSLQTFWEEVLVV